MQRSFMALDLIAFVQTKYEISMNAFIRIFMNAYEPFLHSIGTLFFFFEADLGPASKRSTSSCER